MGKILANIAGRIATLLAVYDEDFYNVLCDEEGHLQIDVLESALPSGAATATNQATIITAVQSLQNLVGALHDVGLDEIDVNVDSSVLPTDAATETTLDEVNKRLGDETSPASGSANAQLADLVARIGALTTPDAGSTNKLLTDALTALQLIDDLYGALHSVHTDELDVVVESSALPTDAATQTTLALCLTALQLIDNLVPALESVATDRLIVRGEDQLHSYAAPLALRAQGVISGAGGYIDATSPGDGYVWHITHAAARDLTSATTAITLGGFIQGVWVGIVTEVRAIPIAEWVSYKIDVWLEHDDFLQVTFVGALALDTVTLDLVGHTFTKET